MIVKSPPRRPAVESKRVGIYCRQSVSDPNDEYGSVVAQREQVELFVESQRSLGWTAVKTLYNDTNASGGNTDRPALQQLLKDIEAGTIDVLCVYKIDRLSRSLLDFTQLLKLLDEHGVAFVSTTQQFNTATSVGRLIVNILATFAQFERETISERTKDKARAALRRGLWMGGRPPLGYDVGNRKLVVNPEEAERVRAIFELYLTQGSLLAVALELGRRGWKTKSWLNRVAVRVEGVPFDKNLVRRLLTDARYLGLTRLGKETFPGEHPAIVDEDVWQRVQAQLESHQHTYTDVLRNKWNSPLKGLVRCGRCGKPMTLLRQVKGTRQYFHYVCHTIQRKGRASCPGSRIPAAKLEEVVAQAVRQVVTTPQFFEAVAAEAKQAKSRGENLRPDAARELRDLEREKKRLLEARKRLVAAIEAGVEAPAVLTERLSSLDRQLLATNERLEAFHEVRDTAAAVACELKDVAAALTDWTHVWDELFPEERRRVLTLLIERVDFDPATKAAEVTLRTTIAARAAS
jgi:site-specific DNA recombinase